MNAYQLYLKGRFYWNKRTEENIRKAIEQFKSATEKDPNFALAYAGLADCHSVLLCYTRKPVSKAIPQAKAYATRALEIDGSLFQRALLLSPHDPLEWLFYDVLACAYLNAGRYAEGMESARRLIALSPNYYWGYLWSAMNALGLGKIEEAQELILEAKRVKPELSFELARKCLGTMAADVDRRFCGALRQAGLE